MADQEGSAIRPRETAGADDELTGHRCSVGDKQPDAGHVHAGIGEERIEALDSGRLRPTEGACVVVDADQHGSVSADVGGDA
jgi:hypothetical protein